MLYVEGLVIDGAAAAVTRLKKAGLCCRFVTNTSTLTLQALHEKVSVLGLPIEPREIISAPQAVLWYLRQQGDCSCALLLADALLTDFTELRQVAIEQADFIVLGDIGDAMSYALLNRIFNRVMQGGQLVAIHKNRFWQTASGLKMDIGGAVSALEYCTGRPAIVMGKPSADFFRVALTEMDADAREVVMVGDDIDSDVGGAQQLGLWGILTRTGKFRQSYVDASSVQPDLIIDSIRDLPAALGLA